MSGVDSVAELELVPVDVVGVGADGRSILIILFLFLFVIFLSPDLPVATDVGGAGVVVPAAVDPAAEEGCPDDVVSANIYHE